ncbi:MAG: hypothetical protein IT376_10555 [Polyangiaceae bacterium]|nr:hypothetical protein [Polyangiaceae bacterium]
MRSVGVRTDGADTTPKVVEPVPIAPPPGEQRARRGARFAREGEPRTRYSLPAELRSSSPVGYRTRLPMTLEEAKRALSLLSLPRPSEFDAAGPVRERELFEECSLGVLTARQSTNFRGHRETVVGPRDSERVTRLLRELAGLDAPVLERSAYTHLVATRPYRTPFTALLTFVGHSQLGSIVGVPLRALRKRLLHEVDMPTIGYLTELHVGILADAMERAALIASGGRRRANVLMGPFTRAMRAANREKLRELEAMAGIGAAERAEGWRLALVAQVGEAIAAERAPIDPELREKLGANLMAFRSERIQPGVNAEEKAPAAYQRRQSMDVPEELVVMAGRAAYNAFAHFSGCDREKAKALLLLERIDVLTPGGKGRLREVRRQLDAVTDQVIRRIPVWADLGTGRALTRNAARGKKAFALAGQRIYVTGLPRPEVERAGLDWDLAVRAVGAAASRAALVAEIMGTVDLPGDCDLLAGTCLMAGPVNQNDIGKTFFGEPDLLEKPFPGRGATSLLVWTLKAKTVADPIGNEEQLLNAKQKGALVDLRPGPHEVVSLRRAGLEPLRSRGGRTNEERAFAEAGNFVTDPEGRAIPGNAGAPWPRELAESVVWE